MTSIGRNRRGASRRALSSGLLPLHSSTALTSQKRGQFPAAGAGALQENRPRLVFEPLEPRILLSADIMPVNMTTGHQDLTLQLSGSIIQAIDTGTTNIVASANVADVTNIQVTGTSGADRLVIDSSISNLVVFNAGDGADTLQFALGSTATPAVSQTTDFGGGAVAADTSVRVGTTERVRYSGIETVADNTVVTARAVAGTAAADIMTLADGGVTTTNRSLLGANGQAYTFLNPTTSLALDLGAGADSLTMGPLDAGFTVAIDAGTVADADADTLAFTGALAARTITGFGAGDTLNLTGTTGTLSFDSTRTKISDSPTNILDGVGGATLVGGNFALSGFAADLLGVGTLLEATNVPSASAGTVRLALSVNNVAMPPVDVVIPTSPTVATLVGALNAAFAAGGLSGLVTAEAAATKIALRAVNPTDSLTVSGGTALGFSEGQTKDDDGRGMLQLIAAAQSIGQDGLLSRALPLVGQVSDAFGKLPVTLANAIDLPEVLIRLREALAAQLSSGTATTASLETFLDAFTGTALLDRTGDDRGLLGTPDLDLGALGLTSTGSTVSIDTSTGTPRFKIDLGLTATRGTGFDIDLGETADLLGLDFDGTINFAASLGAALSFGVTLPSSGPSTFFNNGSTYSFTGGVNATGLNAALNFGFLDAALVNGSASYQVGVNVASSGVQARDTTISSAFAVDLPITVTAAGLSTSTIAALTGSSLKLTLNGADGILSGLSPTLVAEKAGGAASSLLDFANITPGEVLPMLQQLADFLGSVSEAQILSVELPFAQGQTLGDLLNFAESFKATVLDPLFVSGDAAKPDNNGDGTPDFNFSSVQTLITKLSTALGVPALTANYDPVTQELTFPISFNKNLFAETTVANATGSEVNRLVQTVTVDPDDGFVFALAFGGRATTQLRTGATAAQVRSALEGISGIGVGNVGVTQATVAGNDVYTVTFQGKFAGTTVEALDANVLPVDFDLDLGDLAGVESRSTVGLNVNLQFGLTFGIDLAPSSAIVIAPAIYESAMPANGVLSGPATFQLKLFNESATSAPDTQVASVQVSVARDATNTTPTDLLLDVQNAVSQALSGVTGANLNKVLDTRLGTAPFALASGGGAATGSAALPANGRLTSDLHFEIKAGTGTPVYGILFASATAANTTAAELALDLSAAIAKASAGVAGVGTITASVEAGKMKLTAAANIAAVAVRAYVPDVVAELGGGRIALSPRPTTVQPDPTLPAQTTQRRLEVAIGDPTTVSLAETTNPALTELGLLSSPLRFDGKLRADARLEFEVDGTAVEVKLLKSATTDNTSIDHLIADLNGAIDAALLAIPSPVAGVAKFKAGDVEAFRVSADGNRVAFRVGETSTVSRLSLGVSEDADPVAAGVQTNGAIVDLGLDPDLSITQRGKATEFFVEGIGGAAAGVSGTITLDLSDIDAAAHFGFLGIGLASNNTDATNEITVTAALTLQDPFDGDNRATLEDLGDALAAGKFLHDATKVPTTRPTSGPAPTGIIEGSITADIDLAFDLTPSIGFGSPSAATFTASLEDADLLAANPLAGLELGLTGDGVDAFNGFADLDFDDVLGALRQVVDFLRGLEDGTDPVSAAVTAALNLPLPLIERSIGDILALADQFAAVIEEIESDPTASIQALETVLRQQFGFAPPAGDYILSVDTDGDSPVLRIDLDAAFEASAELPVSLDLADYLPEVPLFNDIVGVDASGDLAFSIAATLSLALGIELDSTPEVFFYTDDTSLEISAEANGTDLDFGARVGPFSILIIDGSASIEAGLTLGLDDTTLVGGAADGRLAIGDVSADALAFETTGSASATLPIAIGSESDPFSVGDLTVEVASLQDFFTQLFEDGSPKIAVNLEAADITDETVVVTTPDVDALIERFTSPPSILDLIRDPSILVDGLDSVLDIIEDALRGQVLGIELPFIGDALSGAADFIDTEIRDPLLRPLAQLLRSLPDPIESIKGLLETAFASLLDGEVEVIIGDDDEFLEFRLTIGQSFQVAADIGFDLGIPALSLDVDAELETTLSWSLDLGFGIDITKGFYFVTERELDDGTIDEAELELGVDVEFADGASIKGQLGFLVLDIQDGVEVDGQIEKTGLHLAITVDITDPGEDDDQDGRLTFPELISGNIADLIVPKATGGADLRLAANVNFGPGLGSVLPQISTDIFLDWDIEASTGGIEFTSPSFGLRDIELDLGSFISDFAGPILSEVKKVLDPLSWLIGPDGLLNLRLPILSDLSGSTVTFRTLAEQLDPQARLAPFLDAVDTLYFLIGLVDDLAANPEGSVKLAFGDLVISDAAGHYTEDAGWDPISLPGIGGLPGVGDLRALKSVKNLSVPTPTAPDLGGAAPTGSKMSSFVSQTGGGGALSFPILEPANIFKLLLGNDAVSLVEYDLPPLGFEFLFRQEFPIFGPLVAFLSGAVGARLDLSIGYDTKGLAQFMATDNPVNLVNGFYIGDLVGGVDVPEATLVGEIAAGAGISLGIAKGGVEGGIRATINFNLADLDDDGKIRLQELANNLVANSFNPISVFDVNGAIDFFLRAFFEINLLFTKISFEQTIADIRLFEFEIPFVRPSNLATQSGGTLTLSAGANSADRLQGNLADIAERINVKSDASGNVWVWSDQFNVPESLAQQFNGVTKIIVDGGLGNDVFDLSRVQDEDIVIQASGGAGNDTITGGAGKDAIRGDEGDDALAGGGNDDLLEGGLGIDTIHGNAGKDAVRGGEGNDVLFGDEGDDAIDGGRGDDAMDGGAGLDTFDLLTAGSIDTINNALGGADDVLDFSDRREALNVYLLTGGDILVGWGRQGTTDTNSDGVFDYAHQVFTTNGSSVARILGGDSSDTFYVQAGSVGSIVLDGQGGSDTYILVGASGATANSSATVTDTGNPWDTDAIVVEGTGGADSIEVTDLATRFVYGGFSQTLAYTSPTIDTANPENERFLSLEVRGRDGNDAIAVKSTSVTVPVRVAAGEGDDTVTIGNATNGLDDIKGRLLEGLGVGPLVVVGGAGSDTIVLTDAADTSANIGSLDEAEVTDEFNRKTQVATVSGLDMQVDVNFDGFETADLRLGSGADSFTVRDTIGAGLNSLTKLDLGAGNDDLLVEQTAAGSRFDLKAGLGQDTIDILSSAARATIDLGAGADSLDIRAMTGDATVLGGSGVDIIRVNVDVETGERAASNGLNAELTIDGQADADEVFVNLFGVGAPDFLINVLDTGAAASGTDRLQIDATALDDTVLMRAGATGTGFVALLNSGTERVNFDKNLDDLILNTRGGDDFVALDDTIVATTINLGAGADRTQIGQLYASRRDGGSSGIGGNDYFATIETTRGYLSNGISEATVINGGDGNDEFVVFHNLAVLTLNGGNDDDDFLVRAFALAGSQDDLRERTDISGDGGADNIQYAVNAPVAISGGDGFDTVTIIGTEFGDDFVVTDSGVYGAGLNVTFGGVESLVVDGAEGDDRFFVLSTNANLITQVIGGKGSDTITLNGPTPTVISNDLLGHSGLITHSVESTNAAFDGRPVNGVSANVGDNDEPFIRIVKPVGAAFVTEAAGTTYQYGIVLSRPPESEVVVQAIVSQKPPEDDGATIEFTGTGDPRSAILTFTAANWNTVQYVTVVGRQDSASEGSETAAINHRVIGGETLKGSPVGAVSGLTLQATSASDDFPTLNDGLRGATIEIVGGAGIGQSRLIAGNTADTLTLFKAWDLGAEPNGSSLFQIKRYDGLDIPSVFVEVADDDEAGLDIRQTGGSTQVFERRSGDAPGSDTYTLGLTKAITGGEVVTVALTAGTQVALASGVANFNAATNSFTFDASNWSTAVTLTVTAVDDAARESFHIGEIFHSVSSSVATSGYNAVASQRLIVNVADNEIGDVLVAETGGSTDVVEGATSAAGTDTYTLVLTADPGAGQSVTVEVAPQLSRTSRGEVVTFTNQVAGSPSSLTFTSANWWVPQTVTVSALDDLKIDGGDTQIFAPVPATLTRILGPLLIEGGFVDESISDLSGYVPLMLGTENNFTGFATAGTGTTLTVAGSDIANFGDDLSGFTVKVFGTGGTVQTLTVVENSAVTVGGQTVLTLDGDLTESGAGRGYQIFRSNPNFLVNEADQVDRLTINDTDSVTDSTGLLTGSRLTGLGMGGDTVIGGQSQPGGITYAGLEELFLNLGIGDNRLTIDGTHAGITRIETGAGADTVDVRAVMGHTFVQTGAGSDTVRVGDGVRLDDGSYTQGTADSMLGLLTLSGDVAEVTAVTIGHGSPAQGPAPAVNEVQRLTVDATGGTFTVTVKDVRLVLEALDPETDFAVLVDPSNPAVELGLATDISNIQGKLVAARMPSGFGVNAYQLGGDARFSLVIDGVTHVIDLAESQTAGASQQKRVGFGDENLTIDDLVADLNEAFAKAGLGGLIKAASQETRATTSALAFDTSAAALAGAIQAALEDKGLVPSGSAAVTATRNGSSYDVTFSGAYGSQNVPLLVGNDLALTSGLGDTDRLIVDDRNDTTANLALLTGNSLTGLGMRTVNEVQTLVLDADLGTFTLSFGGATTIALAYNASASVVEAALEALDDIGEGNVAVTRADDVYVIRFQGLLTDTNVAAITADAAALSKFGGTAGSAVITTRFDGFAGEQTNEVQTLTLAATGGTFRLTLGGETTGAIAFDADATAIRAALERLAVIGGGDVAVTRAENVFTIAFGGRLSGVDLPGLLVDAGALAGTATVANVADGVAVPTANDVQTLTVAATSGAYRLEISYDTGGGVMTTRTTALVDYDASAEDLRRALQLAVADDQAERFKTDIQVEKNGNTYVVAFEGKLRGDAGGLGVGQLKVLTDIGGLAGDVAVETRMDGITYFGFETLDIGLGSGTDILSVQGTTAGSSGFRAAGGIAVTNVSLGDGDDSIFVSSNADLDTAGAPGFQFLTGTLDRVLGTLNLNAGAGRHTLMISDEASAVGDGSVRITDQAVPGLGLSSANEIRITGLAPGAIGYGAAPNGNFFGGISYFTGSGADTITIDGTASRADERTPTSLNTGLGGDAVTVNLTGGQDGFFVLNTMGGADPMTRDASGAAIGATPPVSDDDTVDATESSLPLVIFGGLGKDTIRGGSAADIVFGDFGRVLYSDAVYGFGGRGDILGSTIIKPFNATSVDIAYGHADRLYGSAGEDVVIGGAAGDAIDGGADDDLIFGDSVTLDGSGAFFDDDTSPRFRALMANLIYANGLPQVAGPDLLNPDGSPAWAYWQIDLLNHTAAAETAALNDVGDDYIAGGADADTIFGQLGDDVIQGDGSIDLVGVGAARVAAPDIALTPTLTAPSVGTLLLTGSVEAETDGDDYIEGNGGNDVIFGNLGQDDIVGGSSSLFSLTLANERPDGDDIIFGGAGTRIDRNNLGDTSPDGHARDADVIAGDNANIFRLVGLGGEFLSFAYDQTSPFETRGSLRIVPRAVELLDYTPGGLDFSTAAVSDIGGADEVHGEAGDDTIYGMMGSDILFGDAQDDDVIGGVGHDWISGGAGIDGILGDDGRLSTMRNGTAEPLFGLAATTQTTIASAGNHHVATINVTGELTKVADLTPFNVDPLGGLTTDQTDTPADDIIYGGWGSDFIHGGAGDDAISGAEATATFFAAPTNPGDVLRFGLNDPEEFADYNENAPMTALASFILAFDATEGPTAAGSFQSAPKQTDGDDRIFGDLGNDWLVGGTGRDHLYGGFGNDLLNADDDQRTAAGLNTSPDTDPTYEDIAFGGAGRDVLIANTGGDRLIDWNGEFNSYLVPFSPFGASTIFRAASPSVTQFLYDLSAADGADRTLGIDPARNGEPNGEIGLVTQRDPYWGDQKGAPADPQPGNSRGSRDVRTTSAGTAPVVATAAPVVAAMTTSSVETSVRMPLATPLVVSEPLLVTEPVGITLTTDLTVAAAFVPPTTSPTAATVETTEVAPPASVTESVQPVATVVPSDPAASDPVATALESGAAISEPAASTSSPEPIILVPAPAEALPLESVEGTRTNGNGNGHANGHANKADRALADNPGAAPSILVKAPAAGPRVLVEDSGTFVAAADVRAVNALGLSAGPLEDFLVVNAGALMAQAAKPAGLIAWDQPARPGAGHGKKARA